MPETAPRRPLGSPGFVDGLEKLLNRVLEPRKPGMKPRSKRTPIATSARRQS